MLPRLRKAGLSVAVVKHDAHALDIDRPGKDSDRLFKAGADVLIHDPRQALLRLHAPKLSLQDALKRLGGNYDLILVEGHKSSPVPKLWLLGADHTAPPAGLRNVLAVLPRDAALVRDAWELLTELLGRKRRKNGTYRTHGTYQRVRH